MKTPGAIMGAVLLAGMFQSPSLTSGLDSACRL